MKNTRLMATEPRVLNKSCDESSDEGGGELAPDGVEEVAGNLDEVPEAGLALGVGKMADLKPTV